MNDKPTHCSTQRTRYAAAQHGAKICFPVLDIAMQLAQRITHWPPKPMVGPFLRYCNRRRHGRTGPSLRRSCRQPYTCTWRI